MGLGFAACESVEESLSQPVTNPQETIFDSADLSVTPTTSVIDLQTLNDNHARAQVATSVVSDFPSGSQLQLIMEMSKNSDYSNAVQLTCTLDSAGAVTLGTDALDAAYYQYVSRQITQGSAYVRFIANAVNGTETVRIGGPNVYYGAGQISILPFQNIIEDTYYLVGGTDGNYTVLGAMTNGGDDPYENPVFTSDILELAAGTQWLIVPATTVDGGASTAYAPMVAADMSGTLTEGVEDDLNPGVISDANPYIFKANIHDLTYSLTVAIKNLYTPGVSNDWQPAQSQMLYTNNYVNYQGYAHLSGEFKFTSQPDWDGTNFGAGSSAGTLSTEGGNLSVSNDALYWCEANLNALTYSTTEITTYGVIGNFNGWSGSEALTPSADFLTWSGTITLDGGGWKFRANDDWGINLGGSLDNLTPGGADLTSEAGTYLITLDLSALPYTATLVKQ